MAKIKFPRHLLYPVHSRHILCVLVLLIISASIPAGLNQSIQGKKKIVLNYADVDDIIVDKVTGKDIHHFVGNVQLEHNEITMTCDSAYYFPDKNQVTAFSKIHIEQGDTLDIYGDFLFYDGKKEQALLKGNVELVNKETHLFTNEIDYDVSHRIARYDKHGRIINAKNTLTSRVGIYYLADNLFHFKDSVKVVNPDYVMTADTMNYNTRSETALFSGPTELKGDSLYLFCMKGWYDTKNKITSIWENAFIDNKKQVIHGDSIFFN